MPTPCFARGLSVTPYRFPPFPPGRNKKTKTTKGKIIPARCRVSVEVSFPPFAIVNQLGEQRPQACGAVNARLAAPAAKVSAPLTQFLHEFQLFRTTVAVGDEFSFQAMDLRVVK